MISWRWLAGAAALPALAGGVAFAATGWPADARSLSAPAYALLIETVLVAIAAALAGVASHSGASGTAAINGTGRRIVVMMATVSFPIAAMTLVSFGLGTIFLVSPNTPLTALAAAHVLLGATGFLFAAIGALAAAYVPHELDAALIAVGSALLAGVGALGAGPLMAAWPERALNIILTLTPPVAIGAAANIDVFHLDAVYRVSPIAHVQFAYPSWPVAIVLYLTLALAGFAGAAGGRTWRGR